MSVSETVHCGSTISCHFLSQTVFSFSTLSNKVFFVGLLIEVKNDGRALVGIAKRWPRPLSKGGPLMEVKLQFYPTIVFGTLITGRLIKGGGLMAGRLTEVQLYLMID